MHGYPRVISTRLLLDPKFQRLSTSAKLFYSFAGAFADFDGYVHEPLSVLAFSIFPRSRQTASLASRALKECEREGLVVVSNDSFYMPRLRQESRLEYRRKTDFKISQHMSNERPNVVQMQSKDSPNAVQVQFKDIPSATDHELNQILSKTFSQKIPPKDKEKEEEVERGEVVAALPPPKTSISTKGKELALQSYEQFESRAKRESSEGKGKLISLLFELSKDYGYARFEKEADRLSTKILEVFGDGESFGTWLDMRTARPITGAELHRALWMEIKGK